MSINKIFWAMHTLIDYPFTPATNIMIKLGIRSYSTALRLTKLIRMGMGRMCPFLAAELGVYIGYFSVEDIRRLHSSFTRPEQGYFLVASGINYAKESTFHIFFVPIKSRSSVISFLEYIKVCDHSDNSSGHCILSLKKKVTLYLHKSLLLSNAPLNAHQKRLRDISLTFAHSIGSNYKGGLGIKHIQHYVNGYNYSINGHTRFLTTYNCLLHLVDRIISHGLTGDGIRKTQTSDVFDNDIVESVKLWCSSFQENVDSDPSCQS